VGQLCRAMEQHTRAVQPSVAVAFTDNKAVLRLQFRVLEARATGCGDAGGRCAGVADE